MPAALPNELRREIVARRESGESYVRIAEALGLKYGTVRGIYQHYDRQGRIEANYEACRHREIRKTKAIYEATVRLKAAHPGWGAGLIRVELAEQFEERALPSVRTLQRWFRRAGLVPAAHEQQAQVTPQRGQQVHEVWAMDAKEAIRLADGSAVSWLTISDEASGAVLSAQLFPPQTLDPGRSPTSAAVPPNHAASLGLPETDAGG